MKDILYHNPKIEIRKSSVHGYGVFAKDDISKDEVLEEIPFLSLPMSPFESSSLFIDYRFNFPSGGGGWVEQTIPFGFACIYNHSNQNNAIWFTDNENRLFIFLAKSDIKKDEEICTYYGDVSYWNDGRSHVKVK